MKLLISIISNVLRRSILVVPVIEIVIQLLLLFLFRIILFFLLIQTSFQTGQYIPNILRDLSLIFLIHLIHLFFYFFRNIHSHHLFFRYFIQLNRGINWLLQRRSKDLVRPSRVLRDLFSLLIQRLFRNRFRSDQNLFLFFRERVWICAFQSVSSIVALLYASCALASGGSEETEIIF